MELHKFVFKIEKDIAESFELISLVIYNTVRICSSIVKGLLVFCSVIELVSLRYYYIIIWEEFEVDVISLGTFVAGRC